MKGQDNIIDKKFIIKNKIDNGGYSKVYLVSDINNKCEYAAKILYNDYIFKKEKEINKKIQKLKNSNLTKLVHYNEKGILQTIDGNILSIKYFIFEYHKKRDLLQFALFGVKCGEKKCIKFIFKQILEAVQDLHKNGIFHLDIKLKNILINDNYEPKLSDFGLSETLDNCSNGKIINPRGTSGYMSPQIEQKKEYDGIKSDIYSLGISLFELVVGELPFEHYPKNRYYIDIKYNKKTNIKKFWDTIRKKNDKIILSEAFQNLFSSMISYEEEKRPNIESILSDKWFEEINNLNFNDIEDELGILFSQKEYFIRNHLKRDTPHYSGLLLDNESFINKKTYFEKDIKIKKERPVINMDFYIKINDKIDIFSFMNDLANKYINEYFCDNIEESKKDLKFNAIIDKKEEKEEINDINDEEKYIKEDDNEEENKNDDDEEDDEDDDDEDKNIPVLKKLVTQVKIFEGLNAGYILRFKRKEGELIDFYRKISKFMRLAEDLLYKNKKLNENQ